MDTPQLFGIDTSHKDDLKGYQALGSLMGGFPEVAILRRFRSAGALDLIYRQANLQRLIAQWAQVAAENRASTESPQKDFDYDYFQLSGAADLHAANSTLGEQWLTWLEISDELGKYYERLFQFQKLCNLPPADKYQLESLRTQHFHPELGASCLNTYDLLPYDEFYEDDLTSIAAKESPDLVSMLARGPVLDLFHKKIGIEKSENVQVPPVGAVEPNQRQALEFPFRVYSPTYAAVFARILYAIATTVLVTAAVASLSWLKNGWWRVPLLGLNVFLFTGTMAVFVQGKPGEVFGVAAAYAAVLVVYTSSPNPT